MHYTAAYHHESNGKVEIFNRTSGEGLNKISMRGIIHTRLRNYLNFIIQ